MKSLKESESSAFDLKSRNNMLDDVHKVVEYPRYRFAANCLMNGKAPASEEGRPL